MAELLAIPGQPDILPPAPTHTIIWLIFKAPIFIQHITAGLKTKSSQSDFTLEKLKGSG